MAADGGPITDPNLIAQLEKAQQPVVSDPDLIAKLEAAKQPVGGATSPPAAPAAAPPQTPWSEQTYGGRVGRALPWSQETYGGRGLPSAAVMGPNAPGFFRGLTEASIPNLPAILSGNTPAKVAFERPPVTAEQATGRAVAQSPYNPLTWPAQWAHGMAQDVFGIKDATATGGGAPLDAPTSLSRLPQESPQQYQSRLAFLRSHGYQIGMPTGNPNAAPLAEAGAKLAMMGAPLIGDEATLASRGAAVGEGARPPPLPPRPGVTITMVPGANPADFGADTASAARAAPLSDPNLTPADRAAIVRQFNNGRGSVNPTAARNLALSRRISPDFQPTSGQLAEDLNTQREEINNAPQIPELVDRNETNRRVLGGQITELRQRVAPNAPDDNYSVNQEAVNKVQERLDDSRAQVDQAWTHARSIVDPSAPVMDARPLAARIDAEPSFEWTPPTGATASIINRIRTIANSDNPNLTMAQVEQARTALARVAREGEGSERHGAGLVRGMVETSDFLPGAEDANAAFGDARAASVRDFALRDEPAAQNVINGVRDVGHFLDNHALTDSGVQSLRRIFGGDQEATDLIGAHLVDRLQQSARMAAGQTTDLTAQGMGNFIRSRQGAIREALGGENQSRIADLAEGARIITPPLRRAAASTSNSAGPLMAGARVVGNAVVSGLEHIPVVGRPLVAIGRSAAGQMSTNAIRDRALNPHAALAIPEVPTPPVAEMGGPAGRAAEPPPVRWTPRTPGTPGPNAPPPGSGPAPTGNRPPPGPPGSPPPPPPRPGPTPAPAPPSSPPPLPPRPPGQIGSGPVGNAPVLPSRTPNGFPIPPRPATPQSAAAMPDIHGAAQAIARETGSGTVDLADLQRRTGLPLPQLHALVRQEIEAGRATPTRDTSRGRGSKARDAAGMDIGGERYVSVVFR